MSPPAEASAPYLVLDRLEKSFGGQRVLSDFSLTVERGEIFALLGPSGSGKTTALRLLAGFESPDGGEIRIAGERVEAMAPAKRRFGMVFQHYALFPHMNVAKNVAFGLAGARQEETTERVAAALARVDLAGFESRPVTQLSGGQQQRVALARALAPEPRVLLLDEPLSNLDPDLRERTRRELRQAIQGVGITTVLVTHEQEEAFDLGDRVGVLHAGRLQQIGSPEELYERPANPFVAGFVGRTSTLEGTLRRGDSAGSRGSKGSEHREAAVEMTAEASGSTAPALTWPGLLSAAAGALPEGARVQWMARPESLTLSTTRQERAMAGVVHERRFAGPLTYYQVGLQSGPRLEVLAPAAAARPGQEVWIGFREGGLSPSIFPVLPMAAAETTS